MEVEMEELLEEVVPSEDLQRFERKYHRELESDGWIRIETKFEYAFCLVRSRYTNDVKRGLMLFENLAHEHPDGRRDYIYHLAFGNARLKNYTEGLKYCRAFLEIESNHQMNLLEAYMRKQSDREIVKAMALAGGTVLFMALGLLGMGLAMVRK
ncbi:mitochondrial fission 1 protein [Drosophila willistoni]|nr:mitochondrial fission 1 protein [Drosophila willistoni]